MPKVFISYAHKDAWNETQRLHFALELYLGKENLFWDKLIPPGPFPGHLEREIAACDYFVAVMSPYAQRREGWCRKELRIALNNNDKVKILPARISKFEDRLLAGRWKCTYANFAEDFEVGFRQLTGWILGEPVSSWEYFGKERDSNIVMQALKNGIIPAIISKELMDWIIVEQLWVFVESQFREKYGNQLSVGRPRTQQGIVDMIAPLRKTPTRIGDAKGINAAGNLEKIAENIIDRNLQVSDSDHHKAGENAFTLFEAAKNQLARNTAANYHGVSTHEVQTYFEFNVAEKIRELINWHARRSRYLY